jgi:hypothetical protein
MPANKKRSPANRASYESALSNRDRGRLAAYAANATGVYDVDHVSNVLDARDVPNRFLHELLEVKRRQLAGQNERAAAVLDENVAHTTAKVRVMLQVLSSQRA